MKITKWWSNNKEILESIPTEEISAATEVVLKTKKPEASITEFELNSDWSLLDRKPRMKGKNIAIILKQPTSEDDNDHLDTPKRANLLINETGTKTLGLSWDPLKDTFNTKTYKDLTKKNLVKNTKRGISSLITQWWHILMYAEPFKLAGILILQRCWQTQKDGQP